MLYCIFQLPQFMYFRPISKAKLLSIPLPRKVTDLVIYLFFLFWLLLFYKPIF